MDSNQKAYISVTSIAQQQHMLYDTLKSIKSQSVLPEKCYVYLSQEPYLLDTGFDNGIITDQNLQELITQYSDLFSIVWVQNTGPYRKLLNLLHDRWDEDCMIITIDDDTIYHRDFVKDMISDYEASQCCVGNRCWYLPVGKTHEITYQHIPPVRDEDVFNFHTGKGGVIYHPSFFRKTKDLIFERSAYLDVCATTDDIWFNILRMANGVPCAVGSRQFPPVRGKRNGSYMTGDLSVGSGGKYALFRNYNMRNNQNTVNIRKTINMLIERGYLDNI